jgi:hypothetical protein
VRIYAPKRGDAGTYKLIAKFTPAIAPVVPNVDIPDPPKLAAVPPPDVPCDHFDSKNPTCNDACPADAPDRWPGCDKTCRTFDASKPACQRTATCPNPPDRRIDDCMRDPAAHWQACPDFKHADPNNPLCDAKYIKPIEAKIISMEASGSDVLVTIDIGTNSNIDKSWTVHVLRGGSDDLLANGSATIIRVAKTQIVARVHLTLDQVNANQRVLLAPH